MPHTSATTTATHLGRLEVEGHGEQTPDAPGDGNWISRQQRPHSHVREAGRGHQSHRLATLFELPLPWQSTGQVWCRVVMATEISTEA